MRNWHLANFFTHMKGRNSMDELVKLVSQKTALSEGMAKVAVESVVNYLEDKLPALIAGQIDSVLHGARMGGDLEDLASGLGGMLGKK
jgi:hypothetical protein